jgi:hypothetical protein
MLCKLLINSKKKLTKLEDCNVFSAELLLLLGDMTKESYKIVENIVESWIYVHLLFLFYNM